MSGNIGDDVAAARVGDVVNQSVDYLVDRVVQTCDRPRRESP